MCRCSAVVAADGLYVYLISCSISWKTVVEGVRGSSLHLPQDYAARLLDQMVIYMLQFLSRVCYLAAARVVSLSRRPEMSKTSLTEACGSKRRNQEKYQSPCLAATAVRLARSSCFEAIWTLG